MYSISGILVFVITGIGLLAQVQGSIDDPKTLLLQGWVPTWRFNSGVKEVVSHENFISSVSPFSLEVATSGLVIGDFPKKGESWKILASSSAKIKYPIVPSLAWFDGASMLDVLSDDDKRKRHIESIMRAIRLNNYDGIDVDYEGRLPGVKKYYELFIQELAERLHKDKRLLYCTAEARTPLEDATGGVELSQRGLSSTTYRTLNSYCDSIRIMGYDQRDDDLKLLFDNEHVFYRPVADNVWVEKTIQEALYEIDRKKLVLGIPNYGNVYMATSSAQGKLRYRYVGALNEDKAITRANQYHIHPIRNSAGELQYFYRKDGTRYWVTFTDSIAIKMKIKLAEKYGLSGIALFKFDGSMSNDVWIEINKRVKEKQIRTIL